MMYLINHPASFIFKVGLPFLSVESCTDIFDSTRGLINAINSVADECMPKVPENASIVKPVKNPRTRESNPESRMEGA